MLGSVYGGTPRVPNPPPQPNIIPPATNISIIFDYRRLELRPDQARAVRMASLWEMSRHCDEHGLSWEPLCAIIIRQEDRRTWKSPPSPVELNCSEVVIQRMVGNWSCSKIAFARSVALKLHIIAMRYSCRSSSVRFDSCSGGTVIV
ncbi:unnamed protein product [Haemonchus placei]|uniref:Uncharacterized protein n=1 Tax=Haemonchus placei TaxID=6290 RepID=A0A0N4X088_HAEPC|nr:unnamed protein product [Haemonchus placei]